MYSESIVCDCCKRALNPGQPFVRVHVLRTEPAHESPLDALDKPPAIVTCLRCRVERSEEAESTACVVTSATTTPSVERDHRWSDEEHRPRRRPRRGADPVEYCVPCFVEHAPVHVQKLARTALPE